MKRFTPYLFLLLLFILSCEEESNEEYTIDKLSGVVQKGPYVNGTAITVAELNPNLNPTGKSFSTQIVDNKGSFEIDEVALSSKYVEIRADGFYFDEVKGEKSAAQLTLFGLSDVSNKSSINVNLMTQLEKGRVEYLIGQDISFNEAKQQVQNEVMQAFGFSYDNMLSSELLDISKGSEENAILLAISLILQADRSVGDLTELIANIGTDMREDGILNSDIMKSGMLEKARSIDTVAVRKNLVDRYEVLGVDANIPDFEKYLRIYLQYQNPIKISYAIQEVSCNGQSDGAIDITMEGGTAPYSFAWSNGATTEDISGIAGGAYSVVITDSEDYIYYSEEISVFEPDELLVNVSDMVVADPGSANGSINISVSGGREPYAYSWSNDAVSEDLSNLELGGYTVQVTDAEGCFKTSYVALIHQTYEVNHVSCYGLSNGSVNLTVEGGTLPYMFEWSDGQMVEDAEKLVAGTYAVTITDAEGGTLTIDNIVVEQPEVLIIKKTGETLISEDGSVKGAFDITVSGGTAPYTFRWSDGTTTEDISGLAEPQQLLFEVVDAQACSESAYMVMYQLFTDPRDGSEYRVTKIGNQYWMADNMNYRTAGSEYKDEDSASYAYLGRLYPIEVINDVCPSGWHLPSPAELETLSTSVGPDAIRLIGNQQPFCVWWDEAQPQIDLSLLNNTGFNATLGFMDNAWFSDEIVYFYTAEGYSPVTLWVLQLGNPYTFHFGNSDELGLKFAIRCIKD